MSKALSVKMDEEVFLKADRLSKKLHTNRNAYINRAVRFMNRLNERRLLSERYRRDSLEAGASSREVLREFDAFLDEGL